MTRLDFSAAAPSLLCFFWEMNEFTWHCALSLLKDGTAVLPNYGGALQSNSSSIVQRPGSSGGLATMHQVDHTIDVSIYLYSVRLLPDMPQCSTVGGCMCRLQLYPEFAPSIAFIPPPPPPLAHAQQAS